MVATVAETHAVAQQLVDLAMEGRGPAAALVALCWAVAGVAKNAELDYENVTGMLAACWAKTVPDTGD